MADSKTKTGGKPKQRRPRLVNPLFVKRMEEELHANGHKGDWRDWKPTPLGGLSELNHHITKLINALENSDRERVTEHSADIANASMKIAEMHGTLKKEVGAKKRKNSGRV
jgi:hypothetical protein